MWRDETHLLDMLLAARKVVQFTDAVPRERFLGDEVQQGAVMYQIQVLGEAARRISPTWKQQHFEIPWAAINGMRDRLVMTISAFFPSESGRSFRTRSQL